MEVMSPLLLYLVALVPQGLGEQTIRDMPYRSLYQKPNKTVVIQQPYVSHKLLLNLNEPPYAQVSELQAVFHDISCQNCLNCMQRAIRIHKTHSKNIIRLSNSEEMHNDIITNKINRRFKRDSTNATETEIKKERKLKTKKNKSHKSVIVTKYNIDGRVTAMKVKETNTAAVDDNPAAKSSLTTCEVYSIKKSFPCDSPEGDLMVKLAKRKGNKKSRKDKDKLRDPSHNIEKEKPAVIYRKREVDNSQIPESVISSVEEFY